MFLLMLLSLFSRLLFGVVYCYLLLLFSELLSVGRFPTSYVGASPGLL